MNNNTNQPYIPLAERCRPKKINEIVGHDKYFKPGTPFRRQIESNQIPSVPPTGK